MITVKKIPESVIAEFARQERKNLKKIFFILSFVTFLICVPAFAWIFDFLEGTWQIIVASLLAGVATGLLYGLFELLVNIKKYIALDKNETSIITRTAIVIAIHYDQTSEYGIEETYVVFAPEVLSQEGVKNYVPIGLLWQKLGLTQAEALVDRLITVEYTLNWTLCLYLGSPESPESECVSNYSLSLIESCRSESIT